ncbi:hypothetical protein MHU86_6929 [Fragilaria crotonensis]|nr:hypothetical protein MHU86_6929 [Fragilaria crotonensis]
MTSLNLTRTLLSWCERMVMAISWMTWTSNIEHWSPSSPVLASFTVHERVGRRWGCNNAHIQLDASWFRFQEDALVAPYNGRFSFGAGGYVKRLAQERNYHVPDGRVSIWRVSTSIVPKLQRRLVCLASQCSDSEGPRMAPDVIGGHNIAAWPNADHKVLRQHKFIILQH